MLPRWSGHQDCSDGLWTRSQSLRQPNDQREAELALHNVPQWPTADRLDQVQDGLRGYAVASDLLLVNLNLQDGLAGDLLGVHVSVAVDSLEDTLDFPGLVFQDVEVVTEQFHGHIRTDAGDHLVDAKFDWLREGHFLPRLIANLSLDQLSQLRLGMCFLPAVAGL